MIKLKSKRQVEEVILLVCRFTLRHRGEALCRLVMSYYYIIFYNGGFINAKMVIEQL